MIKTVSKDGMVAKVFLAFLATAGLFYVNIMPALIDGLIEGLGFSNQQAGAVGSANMYGAAFGALSIVLLIKRIAWKPAATLLLVGLIGIDLVSMLITDADMLVAVRFADGLVGGMLVGIGFAIIARTNDINRTFGVLLFVQFGLGGLGVMFLPGLVPIYGTGALFLALITFSLITLIMLPFLPRYPVNDRASHLDIHNEKPLNKANIVFTLLAIFTFQGANMGLYAFIIGLGRYYGLSVDFISTTLGIAAWVGLAGAGLVIIMSTRYGHFKPVVIGSLITALGSAAIVYSGIAPVFFIANCILGVLWAFVIAYLLGLAASFDNSGQIAALAGFASKMGLASGPVVAAWLLGQESYPRLVIVTVLVLLTSTLLAWQPTRAQDRLKSQPAGMN